MALQEHHGIVCTTNLERMALEYPYLAQNQRWHLANPADNDQVSQGMSSWIVADVRPGLVT